MCSSAASTPLIFCMAVFSVAASVGLRKFTVMSNRRVLKSLFNVLLTELPSVRLAMNNTPAMMSTICVSNSRGTRRKILPRASADPGGSHTNIRVTDVPDAPLSP